MHACLTGPTSLLASEALGLCDRDTERTVVCIATWDWTCPSVHPLFGVSTSCKLLPANCSHAAFNKAGREEVSMPNEINKKNVLIDACMSSLALGAALEDCLLVVLQLLYALPDVCTRGAGCRVQGAGCRVQGAGCRVQGAGCRVQGARQ